MNTDEKWRDSNMSGICRRVETLEAENKKLKRVGVLIGLSAAMFVTMAQVRQTSGTIPKVIEAQKFILRDVGGKETATLGMTDDGPALDLKWTPSDAVRRLGGPDSLETKLTAVLMEMSGSRTSGKSDPQMWLSRGNIQFLDAEFKPRLTMSSAPAIQLSDEQGFQTTIGRTELEAVKTGESRKTSAASIVIFGIIYLTYPPKKTEDLGRRDRPWIWLLINHPLAQVGWAFVGLVCAIAVRRWIAILGWVFALSCASQLASRDGYGLTWIVRRACQLWRDPKRFSSPLGKD